MSNPHPDHPCCDGMVSHHHFNQQPTGQRRGWPKRALTPCSSKTSHSHPHPHHYRHRRLHQWPPSRATTVVMVMVGEPGPCCNRHHNRASRPPRRRRPSTAPAASSSTGGGGPSGRHGGWGRRQGEGEEEEAVGTGRACLSGRVRSTWGKLRRFGERVDGCLGWVGLAFHGRD